MNGWRSIMQSTHECFICGAHQGLQKHHCMHGASGANRKKAEEDGLYVLLCQKHHDQVHFGTDNKLDRFLQSEAQERYERKHTHEEWMERYGKNYL